MGGRLTEAPGATAATELCTACGLCCRGALHNEVFLHQDELGLARSLGLDVRDKGALLFALPCPHLSGSLCTVYSRRPKACGDYRCQLLRDLDDGKLDLDEALGHVRVAQSLVNEVLAILPAGMTLPDARAITVGRPKTDIEATSYELRATAELQLSVTALTFYLDQHFMNDEDGRYFGVRVVGGSSKEQHAT